MAYGLKASSCDPLSRSSVTNPAMGPYSFATDVTMVYNLENRKLSAIDKGGLSLIVLRKEKNK